MHPLSKKNITPVLSDMRVKTRPATLLVSKEYASHSKKKASVVERAPEAPLSLDAFLNQVEKNTPPSVFAEKKRERKKNSSHRAAAPSFFSRPVLLGALSALLFAGGIWGATGMTSLRGEVLGESSIGFASALKGVEHLSSAEFDDSRSSFREAYASFSEARNTLGFFGNEVAKITRFFPGLSLMASGQGALEGAEHLALAGEAISDMLALVPLEEQGAENLLKKDVSLLSLSREAEIFSAKAGREIALAEESFARVDEKDVPEENRATFVSLREKLPVMKGVLAGVTENGAIIRDLLGENGPRLYLFLFQNNHELRPTGGFIGSYGLLEVSHGEVRKFFIDGIFNPDGQLKEDIVPPEPIQKVSVGWSLHDSNWWPDFPTSAEKAMYFYEKTGGPTVDGVITLTPSVIEELLAVSGPIDLPEYGVTIDKDNFMEVVQEEVEVKYDKELNALKKILSDLSPLLLNALFQSKGIDSMARVLSSLSKGLSERQILLYSRNPEVEKLIDRAGWSGRLLETPKDYASVVHTNLNGYKTDGVIKESIEHKASIQADGSVIDTLRITRTHGGGDTPYEWWNKVNSDYMRVYVPEGSELLSAKGHTYEFPKPPVDYDALGFTRDKDVERSEAGVTIDASGTRVSRESGKTVFGNWVYVSPGESVTVEYVYKLPFSVLPQSNEPSSYSLLFQKQSGSPGSELTHTLSFPKSYSSIWSADGMMSSSNEHRWKTSLRTDAFFGSVFLREIYDL